MDIGLNPESWGFQEAGGLASPLDWQGLRARFLANQGMRRAFCTAGPRLVAENGSTGSFDQESARILATYGIAQEAGLAPVNPNSLGDGNSPSGKNEPVTGNNRPAIEE